MTFLTKAALIEKVAPKQDRATQRWKAFPRSNPDKLTVKDLEAIEGWDEAWQRSKPKQGGDDAGPETPLEAWTTRLPR